MMDSPKLLVEGKDDLNALKHLLFRHGIDCDRRPRPREYPEFKATEGVGKLLEAMETAVSTSTGRAIGFILDADDSPANRWRAIQERLDRADVKMPASPPADGFLGRSTRFQADVGVWLMPDNRLEGKLEHFLQTLIAEEDTLIRHATSSTDAARQLKATFSEADTIKAILHSWLAWQQEPGLPYGSAIRARYFGHESPCALAFVDWFIKLYRLSS